MQILQTKGVPVKIWIKNLDQIDTKTLDQIKLMAQLPHLFKWIAIMPDVHLGKGAVVGGVVATKDILVPNIVGVDIGCGMCAINTKVIFDKQKMGQEFWQEFGNQVLKSIPTGFARYKTKQNWSGLTVKLKARSLQYLVNELAAFQIGSLGGGNHFIEAQYDSKTSEIWLMIHSGSRKIGLEIATYYDRLARKLDQQLKLTTPPHLSYLPWQSEEGQNYYHDMNWAISFAFENRKRMLTKVLDAFIATCQKKHFPIQPPDLNQLINIHHNFASLETHFGHEVIVHRKGATQAKLDQLGIIPGSMGSPSYIVSGKGNPESFQSCSHGAGRLMSRHQARKKISLDLFKKNLHTTFTPALSSYLDEAPLAYKNIEEIIQSQLDLIEIRCKLLPIISLKGESAALD